LFCIFDIQWFSMKIFRNNITRNLIPWGIATLVYLCALFFSIYITNSNTLIRYPIEPYIFGSDPVDLFFPLLTTIPFTWPIYFLKKDNFLQYVSMRIQPKTYLRIQVLTSLSLCFLMVFLVNIAGVVFSLNIANVDTNIHGPSLTGYILGDMQMANPLKFGILWSFYKACIGVLICLLGQTFTYYVKNLFYALLAPFALVFLENFLTAITRLTRFSFTTTFVLNRLSPKVMKIGNLAVGISVFVVAIIFASKTLARYDQSDS
jgi:hypothetical protein